MAVEVARIERCPPAIVTASKICYEDVGVEMRVAGSACAMTETGGDEAGRGQHLGAGRAPSHATRLSLEVGERGIDGGLVGRDRGGTLLGGSQRMDERDRLRRRERQVEAGHAPVGRNEPLPHQIGAGQHRTQVGGGNHAAEAEQCGGAEPTPRCLPRSEVVLLLTSGDGVEVVALRAGS